MSYIRYCREVAAACVKRVARENLLKAADRTAISLEQFKATTSNEAMIELVGNWTRMALALDAVGPITSGGPPAGRQPVPKKKAA